MAEIEPFRGLRFDLIQAGNPAKLVVPIDFAGHPETWPELVQRGPKNVARLFLEDDGRTLRSASASRALLESWLSTKALQRDPDPSVYVYEQRIRGGGKLVGRAGLIVLLRLEGQPKTAEVCRLPSRGAKGSHLLSSGGPEEGGLEVVPVVGLIDDLSHLVELTVSARSAFPDLALVDAQKVEHRIFGVSDRFVLEHIGSALKKQDVLLLRGAERPGSDVKLALLLPAEEGILESRHMVVRGLSRFEFGKLVKALQRFGRVEPIGSLRDREGMWAKMRAGRERGPTFALLAGAAVGRRSGVLVVLDENWAREQRTSHRAILESQLAQHLLFDEILQTKRAEIEFVDAAEALRAGRERQTQLVALFPELQIDDLWELARGPAPTYAEQVFLSPSPVAGLVMRPTDGS